MKKSSRIMLLIFLLILVFIVIMINVNKRSNISREEISRLINKGISYKNIYCECIDKNGTQEDKYIYKKLNNKITEDEENSKYIWIDFDANQNLLVQKDAKKIYIQSNDQTNMDESRNYHNYANIIDNFDYSYKFLGKEEIENRKCYISELQYNDNNYDFKVTLWVDSNTGLLIKEKSETTIDGETNNDEIMYNVVLGTVKESDVERPNLDKVFPNYEIIKYE